MICTSITLRTSTRVSPGFDEEFWNKSKKDAVVKALCDLIYEVYRRRMETLVDKLIPIIKQVYEKQESYRFLP